MRFYALLALFVMILVSGCSSGPLPDENDFEDMLNEQDGSEETSEKAPGVEPEGVEEVESGLEDVEEIESELNMSDFDNLEDDLSIFE